MMSSGVPVYQQSMQQMDKDELHVCPYDPSHRVAAKRFVRHILKCRKNHAGADKVELYVKLFLSHTNIHSAVILFVLVNVIFLL